MNKNCPTPAAEISYTDGELKTINFPEIQRGDLKDLKIDGQKVMLNYSYQKVLTKGFLVGLLCGGLAVFGVNNVNKGDNSPSINPDYADQIKKLDSTRRIYAMKLKEQGWHWNDGQWIRQQIANSTPIPSK